MNIVILDDDLEVVKYVNNVIPSNNQIYLHTSPLDLQHASYFKKIDILFIDIKLKEINGIDFIKQNQNILSKTKIIYITAFNDYIENVFETDPIYFLRKPLTEKKFLKAYEKALNKINFENQSIIVSTQKGKRKIYINEIFYLESNGRLLNIYLKNEKITIYKKISDIEVELNNTFIRTHKSYLVNLNKIKSYNLSKITLENNIIIPISRYYQKKCKSSIINYLKGD